MNLRHSKVTVDLDAIRHNYQVLKQAAPKSRGIAVIKANAYGHGAVDVATALSSGSVIADAFAVATVAEGVQLRQSNITQKIIILGGFITQNELNEVVKHRLDPVIHSQFQIELLNTDNQQLSLWLKVNSGMGRLGFNLDTLPEVLEQLSGHKNITMMSHLASADDLTNEQTTTQLSLIKSLDLGQFDWSIANSAGVLGWQKSHQQWVRFGIALYGVNPLNEKNKLSDKLKPVMQFESELIAINNRNKGDCIGYGSTYVCPQDMLIGIVGAGYADGYPRHINENAKVTINGKMASIIGRVSMDMIAIDLSERPETKVASTVSLWGTAPKIEQVAQWSETIAYELCCHAGAHHKISYLK